MMARYLTLLLLLLAPGYAFAEPERASIELNRLKSRAEGCRVRLLLRNPTAASHERVRLDLLLFGGDGVIARRVVVDAGQLPAKKTMARIFDAPGLACGDVSSVLLNDVPRCGVDSCLEQFTTASRVPGVQLDR